MKNKENYLHSVIHLAMLPLLLLMFVIMVCISLFCLVGMVSGFYIGIVFVINLIGSFL